MAGKGKPPSKPSASGRDRSAISGRYVSPHYAKTHPKTTIHENTPKKGK